MMVLNGKTNMAAVFWPEMPEATRFSSEDAGRNRMLYVWLRSTGMESMDQIRGVW